MTYIASIHDVLNQNYFNSPANQVQHNGQAQYYKEKNEVQVFSPEEKVILIPAHVGRLLKTVEKDFKDNFTVFTLRDCNNFFISCPNTSKSHSHLILKELDDETLHRINEAFHEVFSKMNTYQIENNSYHSGSLIISNHEGSISQEEAEIISDLATDAQVLNQSLIDKAVTAKLLTGTVFFHKKDEVDNPLTHTFTFFCAAGLSGEDKEDTDLAKRYKETIISTIQQALIVITPKRFRNTKKATQD